MVKQVLLQSLLIINFNMMAYAADIPSYLPQAMSWNTVFEYAQDGDLEGVCNHIPDGKCPVNLKDEKGRTALWYAAEQGHADIVVHLIKHGANYELKDADGISPRAIALKKKHTDITKIFNSVSARLRRLIS